MEGNVRKALLLSLALSFFVLTSFSISGVQTSQSLANSIDLHRYKNFALLNFVLTGNTIPRGQGQTKGNVIAFKVESKTAEGELKGQTSIETKDGVKTFRIQVRAEMTQNPDAGKKYVVWLQSSDGLDSIAIGESTTNIVNIINFQANRDLTTYKVIVTQEDATQSQLTSPTGPPKIESQQQQIIQNTPNPTQQGQQPTTGAGTPLPTQSGQQPATGTNTPQPSSGQQPPDLNTAIQSVINEVQESNIQFYLEQLTDNDVSPQKDSTQSRFSQTSGNDTEAQYIKTVFESNGIEVELQPFTQDGVTSNNIVAKIYGTDRSTWYYATAHMDSTSEQHSKIAPGHQWSLSDPAPGADDNGSGTSAVMEIARAIKTAGVPLNASLKFILFSGEEQGLLGSKYYVKNRPQNETIIAVVNMDMIGGNPTFPANCVNMAYKGGRGGNIITDVIVDINQQFNVGLNTQSVASSNARSDHASFWQHMGLYNAIFSNECELDNDVYHTQADTIENLHVDQIARTAQAVAGALVKMSHERQGKQTLLGQNVLGLQDVHASEHGRILVNVSVEDFSEIDELYALAEPPIDDFYEEDVEDQAFIGLFTEEGITELESLGKKFEILDEDTDLNSYMLFYHPYVEPQGEKLEYLGTVHEIMPHYYLVKLDNPDSFDHAGPVAEFFDMPILVDQAPPAYDSLTITLAPTQPYMAGETRSESGSVARAFTLTIAIFALIGIGIGGIIFWKKRQDTNIEE